MNANRGLYRKFEVTRTDGKSSPGEKHGGCRYFVIDIDHDLFASQAIHAYALACAGERPALAKDLDKWLRTGPIPPKETTERKGAR